MKILIYIQSFLNDNIGLITFIVGSFAIWLYLKQKQDHKRDAAKLILQEVRYAEQKIRKFREIKVYQLHERLLPTNSWNDNIHLFIKELKETQNLDLISDFYAKTAYIDTLIDTISRQKNESSTTSTVIQQHNLPQESITPTPIQRSEIPTFLIPPITQVLLNDVSMNVEFIYNTPVVEKLREISERNWYKFF